MTATLLRMGRIALAEIVRGAGWLFRFAASRGLDLHDALRGIAEQLYAAADGIEGR